MLLGICIILACAALIISTAVDPILARLGIKRWTALLIMTAILGLSMLEKIYITDRLGFNIGSGALVIALCVVLFMFIRGLGKLKALFTMLIAAGGVYLISAVIPWNWDLAPFDTKHLMGLYAGIIAAIVADSHRSAVFGSVMGLYLGLAVKFILDSVDGYAVWIIGEGSEFAAITIAAALSIFLSDLIGLMRHRGHTGRKSLPRLKHGIR